MPEHSVLIVVAALMAVDSTCLLPSSTKNLKSLVGRTVTANINSRGMQRIARGGIGGPCT